MCTPTPHRLKTPTAGSADLVSDMLGTEKYKLSWQTALDSFQNPYINR